MGVPDEHRDLCTECGKCFEVCPQYDEVDLIQDLLSYLDGEREPEHDISKCLTCGLCEEVCPQGLSLKGLIKEARGRRVEEQGLQEHHFLADPNWERNLFRIMTQFEEPPERGGGDGEIVYFPGCFPTYVHGTMTDAITRLLDRAGVDYDVLQGLDYCCGVVAAGAGNPSVLRENGPKILEELKSRGTRLLITSCPGCFMGFSKVYPQAFGELDFEVVHISQYLLRLLEEGRLEPGEIDERVFYHDPCHLTRGTGVYREPREVLERIPGVELVNPTTEGSRCCGWGGGVRVNHPSESIAIAREEHLEVKGKADVIISNCAGCRQNLIEGEVGGGPEVYDLAEYLLRSLGESMPRDDRLLVERINRAYSSALSEYRPPE
ncbi:MAG: (Fe-S)-binding protein [Methanomassiliicoccales archaeon]